MHARLTHPQPSRNLARVDLGGLSLWWSYGDLVAFKAPESATIYATDDENLSMTTRRQIRTLKPTRTLKADEFQRTLDNNLPRWLRHAGE